MADLTASPTEPRTLREEIMDKIAALVTVAFGLVAALAWNTAIQKTFETYFGTNGALISFYTYAVLVTIVAVLATIWVGRTASRAHRIGAVRGGGRRPIA